MAKRPFVYTPEDINKEFSELWKLFKRNRSADVASINLGVELSPNTDRHNTIQFNDGGNIWFVDREGNQTLLGGTGFAGNTIYNNDDNLISDRTVDLDGNTLLFTDGPNAFLQFNPTDFINNVFVTDGVASQAGLALHSNIAGSNVFFQLDTTDGTGNNVYIKGDAVVDSLEHRSNSHTFIGSAGLGNVGLLSNTQSFIRVSIDPNNLGVLNLTDTGSEVSFTMSLDYSGQNNVVLIEGVANNALSTLNMTALDTRITGNSFKGLITGNGQELFDFSAVSGGNVVIQGSDGTTNARFHLTGVTPTIELITNNGLGDELSLHMSTGSLETKFTTPGGFMVATPTYPIGLLIVNENGGIGGIVSLGDSQIDLNGTHIEVHDLDEVIRFRSSLGFYNFSNVAEYADNAAAVLGGLVVGDVYRTGDILKIVH